MAMTHNRVRLVATRFIAPAAIYFGFFSFYTWPWIKHFDSQFFANDGDGLQNVWNMWWVNHALTHLHQSPWHTNMLHAPYGTTLLGQTMNPFNGFVGVVFVHVLGIVRTYNALVIFSFVFGGVTAFWLCLWFTDRYVPSLVGGFVFTFSAFHFAHAIGHMQLVSLEWMPLFVLLWWKLLTAPSYGLAVGAAVALELVLLCDYYYFVYSVGAAILIAVYVWHKKEARGSKPLLVFVALFILVLPLPLQLLWYNAGDKLQGAHPARIFSTDLLTPFIDGGFWRFASLTDGYWRHVHNFVSESSIYVGVAIVAVFVIAIVRRNRLHRDTVFWLLFAAVFAVLSLGPRLLVHGHSYAASSAPVRARRTRAAAVQAFRHTDPDDGDGDARGRGAHCDRARAARPLTMARSTAPRRLLRRARHRNVAGGLAAHRRNPPAVCRRAEGPTDDGQRVRRSRAGSEPPALLPDDS